jgi:hypothetical protein
VQEKDSKEPEKDKLLERKTKLERAKNEQKEGRKDNLYVKR